MAFTRQTLRLAHCKPSHSAAVMMSGGMRDADECHIVFVVDASGSMSAQDVRQGPCTQRLASVVKCCHYLLEEQVKDGARGVASFISFDGYPSTHFTRQALPSAESIVGGMALTPGSSTAYLYALQRAIEVCKAHPARTHCVVFLSDGQPTDLGSGSSVLYPLLSQLKNSCGNLTFHTIGFGTENFHWLRTMADYLGGTFHDHTPTDFTTGLSGAELMCTFKAIGTSLTDIRTRNASRRMGRAQAIVP